MKGCYSLPSRTVINSYHRQAEVERAQVVGEQYIMSFYSGPSSANRKRPGRRANALSQTGERPETVHQSHNFTTVLATAP